MSAPVDVLAAIAAILADPDVRISHAVKLHEIRAAVADLIAADLEYDAAIAGFRDNSVDSGTRIINMKRAESRRDAAIARCKGEPA
jgi:hypothetical protein